MFICALMLIKKKLKKLIKKNKVKEKIQLSEEIMIIASNV